MAVAMWRTERSPISTSQPCTLAHVLLTRVLLAVNAMCETQFVVDTQTACDLAVHVPAHRPPGITPSADQDQHSLCLECIQVCLLVMSISTCFLLCCRRTGGAFNIWALAGMALASLGSALAFYWVILVLVLQVRR
jgi:hypothetical protein